MTKPLNISVYILLPAAFFIIVGMLFFYRMSFNQECGGNVIASGGANIGGEFELINVDNKKINSADFITSSALIYFGYSYCPDICPYDLQRNMIAIDILSEEGTEVLPVFITIDPERDTPQRLKEFSSFVHPKLLALTGSKSEIKDVMKLFKVYGQKSKSELSNKNDYLMDHSAFTYLVDSSGNFLDYFSRKLNGEELAERIACFIG